VTINRIRRAAVGLAALAALSAGCSGGDTLVPVEGTVYLDGQPVAAGQNVVGYVVLHADPARGNKNLEDVKGDIGPDGKFTISTRDKAGAAPGWYFVTVELARTNPSNPYDYKALIPDKYLDPKQSGLSFEVVPKAEKGRYDLHLEAAPKGK
jgi:hypothetical protein